MGRLTSLLLIALVAGGLAACGGEEKLASPTGTATSSPAETATVSPAETPTASPAVEGEFGSSTAVSASANIFGAGSDAPPSPGGGGEGELPPFWRLPEGARVVTFPSITGTVNPLVGQASPNGPAGDKDRATDIESYEGISGIRHGGSGMFLIGVFLTDDVPSDPAPPRLDFTDREDFEVLEPEVGQTFLIGDGKGRRYRVPPGATRLFLGFADATYFRGNPGWYNNNEGELDVIVEVAKD